MEDVPVYFSSTEGLCGRHDEGDLMFSSGDSHGGLIALVLRGLEVR
jgi:hypothetical protein